MKNSTLIFRSLFFIILIAGSAHLVTYASNNNTKSNIVKEYPLPNTIDNTITEDIKVITKKPKVTKEKNTYNQETDYIIDKWKVSFNNKDFNGSLIYEIKKEKNSFNAYLIEYQDKDGNSEKANNAKTLSIQTFDGYKGKGKYKITYKEKEYEVDCNIDMLDENTFKLSYDYYGYSDIETWKRD